MKRGILFLFMSLLLTQQTNFYHMKDMWEPYIKSKGTQEDFRIDINLKLKQASIKSDPNPLGAIQLHLWYIRSLYSDGRIEEAVEYYKDKIVNGLSDSFTKDLFHHPYSSKIKNCSKDKCLCSDLYRDESNIVENLDILSPNNLKENFINLWLVIGDQKQIEINKKNIHTYQFIHDKSIIHYIEQPTLEVNLRYNVTDPKIQKNNVTFAILPRPYHAESCNNKPDVFKCLLNESAKEQRIHHIRDKYWNDESHKIKEIMTDQKEGKKQTEKYNLDEFNFKDVLEVDNQPILDKNNKNVYAKRVHPINIEQKETFDGGKDWEAVLDTSNSYFPVLKESNYKNDMMNFNRLYIFNGNKLDYARYSFITYKKHIQHDDLDKMAESLNNLDSDDNQKRDNDCFVFIRWQEDNWYLSEYISDEQFNLVIPTEYSDQYDIKINKTSLSSIKNDQFFEGLKRVDISDNLPAYDEYFNKDEKAFVKKNLGLNIEKNSKINAVKIEIKPGDIGNDKLEIFIEPKQDIENNNNSNRMVWIPLLVGFSIMLLK